MTPFAGKGRDPQESGREQAARRVNIAGIPSHRQPALDLFTFEMLLQPVSDRTEEQAF